MKIFQYPSCVKTIYVSLLLLWGFGAGCATVSPREIYIQAVVARTSGDQKGYYDKLLYLASEYPETRAGRRARSTLFSSELLVPAIIAGFAASEFSGFPLRATQKAANEDIPNTLNGIFLTQRAFKSTYDRYCNSFEECGATPPEESNYVYFMGKNSVAGGRGPQDPGGLRLQALVMLSALGIHPMASKTQFLVAGVGNLDGDSDLDIWTIDGKGDLIHLLED